MLDFRRSRALLNLMPIDGIIPAAVAGGRDTIDCGDGNDRVHGGKGNDDRGALHGIFLSLGCDYTHDAMTVVFAALQVCVSRT